MQENIKNWLQYRPTCILYKQNICLGSNGVWIWVSIFVTKHSNYNLNFSGELAFLARKKVTEQNFYLNTTIFNNYLI